MRTLVIPLALGLLAGACVDDPVGMPPEGAIDLAAPWVDVAPEAVEMNANALFLTGELAADIDRLRSLLVVRRGRLVLERYYGGAGVDSLADVRSVTKSIVSTLTGIALNDGDIERLNQPITDFLDDADFAIRDEHRQITVAHLLSMASGLAWADGDGTYNEWIVSGDTENYVLTSPLAAQPGSTFTYNSGAVHLLGVLLEKAVGRPLAEYANEVLFGPLGIARVQWEDLETGYRNGSSGIDLRPRDLARIGQLFLQSGWSDDRSVVPSAWVDQVTSPSWTGLGSVGPVRDLEYGLLWWLDPTHGAYFAWGFGGQFVYVVPGEDLVVVATTDWRGVREDIGPRALQERVLSVIIDGVLETFDP